MFLKELEGLRWQVTPIEFSLVEKGQKERFEFSDVRQYNDFARRGMMKETNAPQENRGGLELTVVLAL